MVVIGLDGGFFLHYFACVIMPRSEKGRPQSLHVTKPVTQAVKVSWDPRVHPYHSSSNAFRRWAPNYPCVRNSAPHMQGSRGRCRFQWGWGDVLGLEYGVSGVVFKKNGTGAGIEGRVWRIETREEARNGDGD